jgi:hypothetical protein
MTGPAARPGGVECAGHMLLHEAPHVVTDDMDCIIGGTDDSVRRRYAAQSAALDHEAAS